MKVLNGFFHSIRSKDSDALPLGIDPLQEHDLKGSTPRKENPLDKKLRKSSKGLPHASTKINPRKDMNFLALTGANTFYITHPEEIIAGLSDFLNVPI